MPNKVPLTSPTFLSHFKSHGIAWALALVASLIYFWPLMTGESTLFFRDISLIMYPVKYMVIDILKQGALPFWNPTVYNGTPLMALMYPGMFYPLNIAWLGVEFSIGFNIFYLLHFLILAASTYALMRHWGVSVEGSLCSAFTALFSGYFVASTLNSTMFISGIWLPSIFWAFLKFLDTKRIGYFFAAIFFQTCQTLGGLPEACIMTDVTLFFFVWFSTTATLSWRDRVKRLLALVIMVGFSLSLTAAQLLPTANAIHESVRDGGVDFAEHSVWSMNPKEIGSLLLPRSFARFMQEGPKGDAYQFNVCFYLGIFPVFLLACAWRFRKVKGFLFWTGVFLAGLFLSLGKNNPVYEFLFNVTPLLNLFRLPEKFFFLSAFALVFIAGLGWDALIRDLKHSRKGGLIFPIGAVLVGLAVMAMAYPHRVVPSSLLNIAVMLVAMALFCFDKIKIRLFQTLLLITVLFDLTFQSANLLPLIDRDYYDAPPQLAKEVQKDPTSYRYYSGKIYYKPNKLGLPDAPTFLYKHLATKERLFPNLSMIYGLEMTDGLPRVGLDMFNNALWWAIFSKSDPERRLRILARSNVKYWVVGDPPKANQKFPTWLESVEVRELENPLPRAYLVGKAQQGKPPHLLNTYYDETFDPRKTVLLEEPVNHEEHPSFEGAVLDIRYRPNHVTLRTRQNGDGFLVLNDTWFPGWSVTVDGEPETVYRANYYFRAVRTSAGEHTIEFDFVPEGFKIGLWISSATVLVLFLVYWKGRRRIPQWIP